MLPDSSPSVRPVVIEANPPLSAEANESTPLISKGGFSSLWHTVFNACNSILGIGLLVLPYVLRLTGWVGIIPMVLLAALCGYSAICLGTCMAEVGVFTYPGLGRAIFGRKVEIAVSVTLYLELFTALVLFLMIVGNNMNKLFPGVSSETFMLAAAVVVWPTALLRHLGRLAYVSILGVMCTVILPAALVIEGFRSGSIRSGSDEQVFTDIWSLPFALTLIMFCYGGHAVLPSIYAGMEDRRQYKRSIFLTFAVACAVYSATAAVGYQMFGSQSEEQFSLNLSPQSPASLVALVLVIVTPLSKYALCMQPLAEEVEDLLGVKRTLPSMIVRTAIVASSLFVTVTVPFFAAVSSLFGALLSSSVTCIFPAMFMLRLRWAHLRPHEVALNVLLLLVGAVTAFVGTASSLNHLLSELPSAAPHQEPRLP